LFGVVLLLVIVGVFVVLLTSFNKPGH
jgi:hypothetical protein